MVIRHILCSILAVGICSAPALVFAQAGDDAQAQARRLYKEGDDHYKAGRYEEAAARFLQAYELTKRPALLYNIANAYERMGEYEKAADYLRLYLDNPRVRDVVSVRERIRRLEQAAEQQRKDKERALAQQKAAEEAAARAGAGGGDVDAARNFEAYLWLAGSGAAFAGTVVFGLVAQNAGNDALSNCLSDGNGQMLCSSEADGALTSETVFAVLSDVSTALGLAAAGMGMYLLLTEDPSSERASQNGNDSAATTAHIGPALLPGGLGVSVGGRF